MGFRVGDKVSYLFNFDRLEGVVKEVTKINVDGREAIECAVEFEETKGNELHDCDGLCKDYHGWYCLGSELKKIEGECNMKNFKYGERVRHKELGVGTIKYGVDDSYAVEFDEEQPHLHSCGHICKDNHGWWCTGEGLEYAHEKAFAVGSRVYSHAYGYGTVKKISECGSFYAVEFDNPHEKLHSCGAVTKLNRGWWCHPKELELVTREVVLTPKEEKSKDVFVKVITKKVYGNLPDYAHEGVKRIIVQDPCVIVELETGEMGKAICHADDEFDEVTGYNIAYRRAMICNAENIKKKRIEKIKKDFDDIIDVLREEIESFGNTYLL